MEKQKFISSRSRRNTSSSSSTIPYPASSPEYSQYCPVFDHGSSCTEPEGEALYVYDDNNKTKICGIVMKSASVREGSKSIPDEPISLTDATEVINQQGPAWAEGRAEGTSSITISSDNDEDTRSSK